MGSLNMNIGFTGSRNGLSDQQKEKIHQILDERAASHLHHGDCIGADFDFHQIGMELNHCISIYPPKSAGLRSFTPPNGKGQLYKEKDFLVRNRDIVDSSELLLACPETSEEVHRSGTWATIRYARKKGKELILIPKS